MPIDLQQSVAQSAASSFTRARPRLPVTVHPLEVAACRSVSGRLDRATRMFSPGHGRGKLLFHI